MKEAIIKLTSDRIKIKGGEYVQDIVRCRECKHREKRVCSEITFYECNHLRYQGTRVGVTDIWFCADGERKESE